MISRIASALVWVAACLLFTPLFGEGLRLTSQGIACDLGANGVITLGLPALDGRKTHAPVLAPSVVINGDTLQARYGAPFDGVAVSIAISKDGTVRYHYTGLPPDLHIVMTQFNLPAASIVSGITVRLGEAPPKALPPVPGKTDKDVTLASVNVKQMEIRWPSGKTLLLDSPLCWHGIQDARIWGKSFIGVCLTPPLVRDPNSTDAATLIVKIATLQQ